MSIRAILSLSLVLAGGAVCAPTWAASPKAASETAQASAHRKSLPAPVNEAIDKGDYAAVQEALLASLRGKQVNPSDKGVLPLLMALEVVRVSSPEILTEFAKKPKQAKFLAQFMNDPEWQELYLGAGLVPYHNERGVRVLYDIWKAEGGNVRNKPLAVALASMWGGGETQPDPAIAKLDPALYNPVWRYNFFQKQKAAGKLHPNYKNLRPWELRFTVGITAQDWDDRSFEWAAENINLPWDKYGWACWAAIYTDPSLFGDSVQSGEYQLPFLAESKAELTQRNGGVCGSLSHLGTYAAMAHGIPAYTVGQPAHCAYAVRPERGKWVGGFGGPDGGMHNNIFGNRAPTSYTLMETVFADNATIDKAYRESFAARALEALGDKEGAMKMWRQALSTSPMHPFFRKELHRLMMEKGLTSDSCFDYLSQTIPLYKGNGFAAVDMAGDLQGLIDGMSDEQKEKLYSQMHRMIADTPGSWAINCSDTITKQNDSLTGDAARAKFLSSLLATHMQGGDGTTFGQVIEWAVKTYMENGNVDIFVKAFAQAAAGDHSAEAAKTGGEVAVKRLEKMRDAYNKAIFAAEKAHSVPGFHALTDITQSVAGACPRESVVQQPAGIGGKPAAPNGMIRVSSTSRWDKPAFHRNMLTPEGGCSHTDKEEKPYFIAELGEHSRLTGCVLRKTNGNEHRMKKATVYTSADGATWMKAAETDNMPKEWVVKFDDSTRGKWVKVEFDNSPNKDFAHLSHFVIYVK